MKQETRLLCARRLGKFLKLLDILVFLAGVFIVVGTFVLERSPTLYGGWALFALGVLTVFAGLTGLPTTPNGRQNCFGFHTLLLLLTALASGAGAFFLITDKQRVKSEFKHITLSKQNSGYVFDYGGYVLGAFCVMEVVSLVMSCGVMRCMIPRKLRFWHNDYKYRQRALAFHEMAEEDDVEAQKKKLAKGGKYGKANLPVQDPVGKERLLRADPAVPGPIPMQWGDLDSKGLPTGAIG